MEYKIKLSPDRESSLIRLLQTWQEIGLIEGFEPYVEPDQNPPPTYSSRFQWKSSSDIPGNDKEALELAKQYRDLVED